MTRTWEEAGEDNAGLVAAGVSFYGFLALVPLLGAIVLSYGLIAEPASVMRNMQNLAAVMPADAAKLIGEQLMNVVKTSGTKKGFGLLLALALALFGARNGAASIVTALNIAYEEKETRSFIRLNLLALAITAAGVLVAIIALVAIAALGHLETLFPGAPGFVLVAGKILSYLLVALGGAAGAATLYRYAPNRRTAKWVWLTPGSLFAAVAWLVLTIGFGIYVAKFGNYNATYGSLGAVVVMLTWLYLSSYVLLLGAELNSELEQQTAHDTATGAEQPLESRGARSADTVAGAEPPATTPRGESVPEHVVTSNARSSLTKDFLTCRAAQWAGALVGLDPVGVVPSLLTTGGLALLKRRERTPAGLALLAAGALLAWVCGRQPSAAPPSSSPDHEFKR
ncbi:YihY/virulence factor BrkB family protein [Sphingomonas sp. PAMC 26617]|uniref:YihY/virulence factor BrkB family protein n=1 Tax=Sphingomonas sp. PAMC 26617 TaxID=1112216 RepID=UPI0002F735C1|nr:YihY/virulence factor BrkB family protein [Sphingomonas sp. PAMC 26617]